MGFKGFGVFSFFSFFFWLDFGGGVLRLFWGDEVNLQEGNMLSLAVAEGPTVSGKGCWDLVEVNCAAIEVQNPKWNSARAES